MNTTILKREIAYELTEVQNITRMYLADIDGHIARRNFRSAHFATAKLTEIWTSSEMRIQDLRAAAAVVGA